jgi:hypothetical protein
MTVKLASDATDSIALDEFVDHLEHEIRVADADDLVTAAPAFKRLLNNRRVLTEFIDFELKNWRAGRNDHEYVGHTVVLARRTNFLVRANVWIAPDPRRRPPAANDPGFGYLIPHDHNFAFLTGAYHGPGYSTVLFEYDADDVVGVRGEPVDLRPCGRTDFPPGTMMLYQPSRDVHYQEHPRALSISLNVVVPGRYTDRAQFLFDVPAGTIAATLTPGSARGTTLCDLAAEVGDDETAELLVDVARRADDPRVRVTAAKALCTMRPAEGSGLIDELRGDRDRRVRGLAELAGAGIAIS